VAVAAELTAVVATTKAVMMAATMAAIVVAVASVTLVGGKDNGGNSNGGGHRQQFTISNSKDTVAVATAVETATVGAAMTAAGAQTTAQGVCADGIAFSTAAGAATTASGTATSAASAARTARFFRRGVAHVVQHMPPLLEEAHAPHSQLEAEEEEVMMGGLCVLVVRLVCAGCVCAVRSCCFVRPCLQAEVLRTQI
jgi:hypothetical protein